MSGWIGVDFDGTLATYDGWQGETVFGEPIPAMVQRVKGWLAAGYEVRLMTARAFGEGGQINPDVVEALDRWMDVHLGQRLSITCTKDLHMIVLYDDRCVQVEPNTGNIGVADGSEIADPRVPFRA